ncbi:MAG: type III secretion system stator protein SctL [Janthinobacterium lividum]
MVIWLSHPRRETQDMAGDGGGEDGAGSSGGEHGVADLAALTSRPRFGVDSGIVARETLAVLSDLDAAYARAEAECAAMRDAARLDAQRMREQARHDAQIMLREAHALREHAAAQGFDEGVSRGLAQWLGRAAEADRAARHVHDQARERIAEIVVLAVERIVRTENRGALFERALTAVDRIVEGSTYLRVTVHPEDLADAQRSFDALAQRWREMGRSVPVSVVADHRMAAGACMCESDLGMVDASIATQMRAMRSAIARAIKASVGDEGRQDEPDRQAHAAAEALQADADGMDGMSGMNGMDEADGNDWADGAGAAKADASPDATAPAEPVRYSRTVSDEPCATGEVSA